MKVKKRGLLAWLGLTAFTSPSFAAAPVKTVSLPAAQMDAGRPLMQVLKERKSSREFSDRELPHQVLANLLWAANGVNRPQSGNRTAPSARNMQEIEVYVAKADGLYLYNARDHALKLVVAADIRATTGTQDFVARAPVNLIYVADLTKAEKAGEKKEFYAAADTGFIAQNVYLFCASEHLATVVRGSFDQAGLVRAMKLPPDRRIILTQTVGFPK